MRGRTSIFIRRRSSAGRSSTFNRSKVQKFKRVRREDNENWLDNAYLVFANWFDWRAGKGQISRATVSVLRETTEIDRRRHAFRSRRGAPDRRANTAGFGREGTNRGDFHRADGRRDDHAGDPARLRRARREGADRS